MREKNNALIHAASQAEKASELIMSEFEHQLAYLQECEEAEHPDVPNIEEDLEL